MKEVASSRLTQDLDLQIPHPSRLPRGCDETSYDQRFYEELTSDLRFSSHYNRSHELFLNLEVAIAHARIFVSEPIAYPLNMNTTLLTLVDTPAFRGLVIQNRM
jgi:hypothetical protein